MLRFAFALRALSVAALATLLAASAPVNAQDSDAAFSSFPGAESAPGVNLPDGDATVFDASSTAVGALDQPCNCLACQLAALQGSSVCSDNCPAETPIDWSKYPATIHPMPRPGIFPIPPKEGPAYFSLWDQLTGETRQAPPKSGYAPFAINAWPFFDADWRYVENVSPEERDAVEQLKRIHLADSLLFSTGGEFWIKHHNEKNVRLTQADNNFNLTHVRLYGDLSYKDVFRVYGEYIWAGSSGQSQAPLPPDVDRGDILDLFVDLKAFELEAEPVYVRIGRQELLYGSQRLITPLPWANKRHSFDGVKVFRHGEKWDLDAFWTQFVPPRASTFDQADDDLQFAGAWATYKPEKGDTVDFYYLMYQNDKSSTQSGIVRAPFETHTFGTRWAGDQNGWLWDFEGALQCGNQGSSDLLSGMATAGLGHNWKDACMTPTVWFYYDYASGDSDPTTGDAHTFNQQFPFGHYYMGWMDLVGRQNIHDVNAHLYLYPTPWMTVWLQYHHFWLAESRDALYNPGGAAIRRDPTGTAGNNVGDEIDLVLNFHVTKYSDILVSYNKLFGGSFLERTAGATTASDAESLYLIFQQRF